MNESLVNFIGKSIYDREGIEFALKVINFIKEKLKEFQEKSGHLYNLEATPAEGTSYRLAKIDKQLYPDIITASEFKETFKNSENREYLNNDIISNNNIEPYYTNSTLLPVFYTDDLFEALEHQNIFQPLYTGGTVFIFF